MDGKKEFLWCTTTGWMNSTIFQQWFVAFTEFFQERPILLIFDGHMSHLDLKTILKLHIPIILQS